MVEDKVNEIINPQALNMMFELDFRVRPKEKEQEHSQEDKKFLQMVSEGIKRTDDGHYEIPLPFRFGCVSLPDNREQMLHRAYWLQRKLKRTDAFYEGHHLQRVCEESTTRSPFCRYRVHTTSWCLSLKEIQEDQGPL